MTNPLLDPPVILPERLVALEAAVAAMLETRLDVVLPQAEAVLPLEAAARSLGGEGVSALNLDTWPYGLAFGRWLEDVGTTVIGIGGAAHEAVRPEAVEKALAEHPEVSLVSFVHAEAATGVRNDAETIAGLAREHGALMVVDLVASFGAEQVRVDDWGVDVAVVGPQKALAGPAGISIAVVSDRAWQAMSDNPRAPRASSLSLLDWKRLWLDTGRTAIPGTPSPLEIIALEAAVARVGEEGLAGVRRRHSSSAAASRAGGRALGLAPFARDAEAASVATTLAAPPGIDARELAERARARRDTVVSPGIGELAASTVRVNHTGRRAELSSVLEALEALGGALAGAGGLRGSVPGALAEAERAWSAAQAALS
jgi:aspartate aminotransferase-like enzyme